MDQCIICAQTFSGSGNDARPLRDGRCCDACNQQKVIPARLEEIFAKVLGFREDFFEPIEPATPSR